MKADEATAEKIREILGRFHYPDDFRPHMVGPFYKNGHTYATDGASIVRVRGKHAGENPDVTIDPEQLPYPRRNGGAFRIYGGLVDAAIGNNPCEHCSLAPEPRKVRKACPECDGEGHLEFNTCLNTYDVECLTCDGDGHIETESGKFLRAECPECGGTGYPPFIHLRAGGGWFNAQYVRRVLDLPGVAFEIREHAGDRFLCFYSDICDGTIMEMRPPEAGGR